MWLSFKSKNSDLQRFARKSANGIVANFNAQLLNEGGFHHAILASLSLTLTGQYLVIDSLWHHR